MVAGNHPDKSPRSVSRSSTAQKATPSILVATNRPLSAKLTTCRVPVRHMNDRRWRWRVCGCQRPDEANGATGRGSGVAATCRRFAGDALGAPVFRLIPAFFRARKRPAQRGRDRLELARPRRRGRKPPPAARRNPCFRRSWDMTRIVLAVSLLCLGAWATSCQAQTYPPDAVPPVPAPVVAPAPLPAPCCPSCGGGCCCPCPQPCPRMGLIARIRQRIQQRRACACCNPRPTLLERIRARWAERHGCSCCP
jgi:hypothetical protein